MAIAALSLAPGPPNVTPSRRDEPGSSSATTSTPSIAGANSFIEGQARDRTTKAGFNNVKNLKQDQEGIWRGIAGAGAGLLASLGLIAIPGIGPLVAAGVLATTLAGAATGAIGGGVIGALVDDGVSREDASVYAESLRRGGSLVSVRAEDTRADDAELIMQRHEPIDMKERGGPYRSEGWQSYDPSAPAFTEKERQMERDRHRPHQ